MNLKSIVDSYKVSVETPDGPIAVRGLSLADITSIIQTERAAAEAAFNRASGLQDGDLNASFLSGEMLQHAPQLVARVLATVIEDPDCQQLADRAALCAQLPAALQIVLLEAIITQTAAVEGGLGKVIEIVISAVVGARGVTAKLGAAQP